jgi:hypothetical protein
VRDVKFRSTDKNQDVYTVATLHVDLSSVPQSAFKRDYSPSGVMYYKLNYDIELSVQSSLEYSVLVNGIRYGSVTAKYT